MCAGWRAGATDVTETVVNCDERDYVLAVEILLHVRVETSQISNAGASLVVLDLMVVRNELRAR